MFQELAISKLTLHSNFHSPASLQGAVCAAAACAHLGLGCSSRQDGATSPGVAQGPKATASAQEDFDRGFGCRARGEPPPSPDTLIWGSSHCPPGRTQLCRRTGQGRSCFAAEAITLSESPEGPTTGTSRRWWVRRGCAPWLRPAADSR